MAINKVIYGGQTLIDLTSINITPSDLMSGVTAFDRAGELIVGTAEKGHDKELVDGTISQFFNSEVSTIRSYAFTSNSSLTSISVPNIGSINQAAFSGCTKLSSVTTKKNVKVGSYAFANCTSLSSIAYVYDERGHMDNATIQPQPNASYVFYRCSNLTEISIYGGTWGASAFDSCINLSRVYIDSINNVLSLGVCAFRSCSALEKLICFDTYEQTYQIASIGSSAFYNCMKLRSITLSLKDTAWSNAVIGSNAFYGCSALEAVIIPYGISNYSGSDYYIELKSRDAFGGTPISKSTILGRYGSIYIASDCIDFYRSASNWSFYSDRMAVYDPSLISSLFSGE